MNLDINIKVEMKFEPVNVLILCEVALFLFDVYQTISG